MGPLSGSPTSEAQVPASDGGPSPSRALSPAATFISKLSKIVDGLHPIPVINMRRKKKSPPSEAPRHSRRIAGLGVTCPEVCAPHLKKKVMRALDMDIAEEREKISQHILDEYAKKFNHPVSSDHTKDMAALFWLVPPDDDSVGWVDCVSG